MLLDTAAEDSSEDALFRLLTHREIIIVTSGVITKLKKKYAAKLRPFFFAMKPGINAHKAIPIKELQLKAIADFMPDPVKVEIDETYDLRAEAGHEKDVFPALMLCPFHDHRPDSFI